MVGVNIIAMANKEKKKFYGSIGPALRKATKEYREQLAKDIQKSAKLRAPRWTGNLARSIKVRIENRDKIIVEATAPYAAAQEFGFRPHFVYAETSARNQGLLVAHWLQAKIGTIYHKVYVKHRGHGYMVPALEFHIAKFAQQMEEKLDKNLRKNIK